MAISNQVLKQIEIHQLKGLKDLTIDFTQHPLTAILAPNGMGKSTILHAIACINNPVTVPTSTVNHRLSEFFTPTTHSIWTGSSFMVTQDYQNAAITSRDVRTHFRKVVGRWAPRYVTRIERYVSYIGIRTCVPMIELETQQARIQFNTTPLTDAHSTRVRNAAGYVMNKVYNEYNEHKTGWNKSYIGVSVNGISYSSLSMGAGEQRVFFILSEVFRAPNYGLIIIDELDLLLHEDALFRLLEKLNEVASNKHLQIVFTTHALSILTLDYIAFRHLYQTPSKTLCFSDTKPDALQRLTGHQLRPLEMFVEDDLAYAIVKKIGSEEGLSKYMSVKKFGAAINCFTTVAGAILNQLDNFQNMLFVLDGDEYSSEELKIRMIGKVLTGTSEENILQRASALEKITQLILPVGFHPEFYFYNVICELNNGDLTVEQREIVDAARQIGNPGDEHRYFNDVIVRMDFTREVGLNKLVDLLSITPQWASISQNIRQWLDEKREVVVE
ncbi:AAA family ATPase [Pedobacter endophyticus]|uniref:AAA family ATPase n=1 Tax=Pedobacter endophyticus TaxID=2789740 RepID=A0A7U3SNV4_9SPHI|nr:AAA family ATPase [Pedobacter endophyticus]QPH37908.1 AAA family ATPase [Pedobacter endophyticus]